MTDSLSTPDDRRNDDADPIPDRRPIPDGGLGSAMPDWMRQTPSWKRQAEPAAVRMIPEAETSIIDPRQLIDIDDLPEWLQAVASRLAAPVDATALVDAPVDPPGFEAPSIPAADALIPAPAPSVAGRPRTGAGTWLPVPGTEAPAAKSEHVGLTPSPLHAEPPWWMSDAVIAFLFVAIVLTLIYVILAAAGVL